MSCALGDDACVCFFNHDICVHWTPDWQPPPTSSEPDDRAERVQSAEEQS